MVKVKWLLFVTFLFLLTGCASSIGKQSPTQSAISSAQPIYSQPMFTRWELIDQPSLSKGNFTFTVNGIYFSDDKIIILYSLINNLTSKISSEEVFQLIDENGGMSRLAEAIPLANYDNLELGMMVFKPRNIGVRKLSLIMTEKENSTIKQEIILARLDGSVADDFQGRTFYASVEDILPISGYKISIAWGTQPNDPSGTENLSSTSNAPSNLKLGLTPTPANGLSTIALEPGVNIQDLFSFRIENQVKNQIEYLGVQVLSDGRIMATSDGVTILQPNPIILETSIPTSTPYPPSSPYP